MKIKTVDEFVSQGQRFDILLWTGCAGSFDERAKRISETFAKILLHCKIEIAILGGQETCTGDPAKRTGNEFLFHMQVQTNIEIFKKYNVSEVVTFCPHCFNTLKNEYSELGIDFTVYHHTEYINRLIDEGKLHLSSKKFSNKKNRIS